MLIVGVTTVFGKSHRWLVRGHWRKLSVPYKIGKDRASNYSIKGFTWVTDHEKGPEDKALVADKTRVFEPKQGGIS